MESKLFWLAAVVQLVVSLRFTMLVRMIERTRITTPVLAALASGQRQDSWVAAAAIWAVILLKDTPYIDGLYLCGVGTLAWLTARTFERIGGVAKATRD